MPGTDQKQQEAIERITSCIALRDQQQAKLSAWLKHNEAGGTTATHWTLALVVSQKHSEGLLP